jgi:hypothetical protein
MRYRSSCFLCRVLTGSSFSTARKNPIGSTNNQREEHSLIEGSPYLGWSAPGHTPLIRALPLFYVAVGDWSGTTGAGGDPS